MQIGHHTIGRDAPPFIIAEMSGNHNQSLDRALEIVDAAAATGAHALKLQTYTADTITLDVRGGSFDIEDENSLWKGRNLHDLYKQAHTPWEWHGPIMERARKHGMVCFSSPFDETAVDFLLSLDVPAFKIASFENVHLPLIRKVAATGKPIIMSTGMASLSELDDAVRAAREAGCENLILLKCTSTYPATPENTNVLTVPHMRDLFGCEVGLSDHTMGVGVAIAAVAHGATVVEKHFTTSRADGGPDSDFSLEPDEFKRLCDDCRDAWLSLGRVSYNLKSAEEGSAIFRRSLYVTADIPEGQPLTRDNVRSIRPGYGLPPRHLPNVLGKVASRDLARGTALTWDMVR